MKERLSQFALVATLATMAMTAMAEHERSRHSQADGRDMGATESSAQDGETQGTFPRIDDDVTRALSLVAATAPATHVRAAPALPHAYRQTRANCDRQA